MRKARRDPTMPDLFRDFQPKPVVDRYDPDRVRAAKRSSRIARAVAEAMKDCGLDRPTVAHLMSEYLGENVTKPMLDQHSSPSSESHNISAHRLVALAVVTEDARLFNALLDGTDIIAVPAKFEALIRRELARDARDKLDREANAADAEWKAGR